GLVALWRETLLARHVLEGRTKGYTHHPQLTRFKEAEDPLACLHFYLEQVYQEATKRGYRFDPEKFRPGSVVKKLNVTKGQINYEAEHLLRKLYLRDRPVHHQLKAEKKLLPHPLFHI